MPRKSDMDKRLAEVLEHNSHMHRRIEQLEDENERLRADNHVLREMNRQREEFGAKAVRLAFPHLNNRQ